jgi:glycine/sarcosine/betaine reductase complex component A
MDLENQKRVKALAEQHGKENIVVLLGGADAEASGLIAETVLSGDPAFAGALTGVPLGLPVYHILEPEVKQEIDPAAYEKNISMMEMVLDVEAIVNEVSSIRKKLLA